MTGVDGWLRLGALPDRPVFTESVPVLVRVATGAFPPSAVTVALSPVAGVKPPAASAGVIALTVALFPVTSGHASVAVRTGVDFAAATVCALPAAGEAAYA